MTRVPYDGRQSSLGSSGWKPWAPTQEPNTTRRKEVERSLVWKGGNWDQFFSLARKAGMWEQASALLDQMRENGLMLVILHMATVFFQYRDKKVFQSHIHFAFPCLSCPLLSNLIQFFPLFSDPLHFTPFHSFLLFPFSFRSLSAFPFSSFPSVPPTVPLLLVVLLALFILFNCSLVLPRVLLVFFFFSCFSCFSLVFTFVSFCFFSLFFSRLAFLCVLMFSAFLCFPYLVDFHMLTIGSTTFNFPVHFVTPFRCVVLCSVPLAFPAFFSSPLHFFPIHFFSLSTYLPFLCPLLHSSTVSRLRFSLQIHPSIPVHIPVLRLQLLFLFPVVSISFFSSSFRSFPLQSNSTCFTLFRAIPFHPIPSDSFPVLSIPLHPTPFHSTTLHCSIAVHFVSFRSKPFRITPLHSLYSIIFFLFLVLSSVLRFSFFFYLSLSFYSMLVHSFTFQSSPFHSTPAHASINPLGRSVKQSLDQCFCKIVFQLVSFSLMLSCFSLFSLSLISGRQERRTPEVEKVKKTWRRDNTLPHVYFSTCVPSSLGCISFFIFGDVTFVSLIFFTSLSPHKWPEGCVEVCEETG